MASSAKPTRQASHKESISRQGTACNYFFLALDAPEARQTQPRNEGSLAREGGGAERRRFGGCCV